MVGESRRTSELSLGRNTERQYAGDSGRRTIAGGACGIVFVDFARRRSIRRHTVRRRATRRRQRRQRAEGELRPELSLGCSKGCRTIAGCACGSEPGGWQCVLATQKGSVKAKSVI